MTSEVGFSVVLSRLMESRHVDVRSLAGATGLPEPELAALVQGGPPSPAVLHGLASALDLRAPDLFLVAGVPVPDDLLPRDVKARTWVELVVYHGMTLSADDRAHLRQRVLSLPTEPRTEPFPPSPGHELYPPGPGALLLRMLHVRNLAWIHAVKVLGSMTGVYLAAATMSAVGHGRKELDPGLAAAFGVVLGMRGSDLAALIGVDVAERESDPAAGDMAEFVWEGRRLTSAQARQLSDVAKDEHVSAPPDK